MSMRYERILIVEDVTSLAMTYCGYVRGYASEVEFVSDGLSAVRRIESYPPDVVLLDLNLPDMSGLDILRKIRKSALKTRVIVITADGSVERAVEAMREGAVDFLVKPFTAAQVHAALNHIKDRDDLAASVRRPVQAALKNEPGSIIGKSAAIRDVSKMIEAAAKSTATVFITGASGTGKEVCASALHANSDRADKPFVALNCAAIPRDLLESELFGHVKGAFTGASSDRLGAALKANGGTLFLDEIGEMSLAFQAKILRFLETRTVQRVGEDTTRDCDVRIVCATNRDPHEEVAAGRFREDLFYRLHVLPINMPLLSERGNDIVLLAEHFLGDVSRNDGKTFLGFSDDAKAALLRYRWPGNIRELKNVIQRLVALNEGGLVELEHLPTELQTAASQNCLSGRSDAVQRLQRPRQPSDILPLEGQINAAIEEAIAMFDGSIPKAAEALQVSPSTIYRRNSAKRH